MKTIKCLCGQDIQVDDQDYDKVSPYVWECATSSGGIVRIKSHYKAPIAFVIMGYAPDGMFFDHKDLNKHNNQRDNLRVATRSQNNANRKAYCISGFKGVKRQANGRYMARITFNKKEHYLGIFDDPVMAAKAYDIAAKKFFGEFARTNFESSLS